MQHNDGFSATGGVQAYHQAAVDAGRFLIQRCTACRRHVYFPREICSHCGSCALAWVEPCGRGTVYATTVVRDRAGKEVRGIVLIDLDEGVRLMSRVEGEAPSSIRIGQRVRASVQATDGRGLLIFHLDLVGAPA